MIQHNYCHLNNTFVNASHMINVDILVINAASTFCLQYRMMKCCSISITPDLVWLLLFINTLFMKPYKCDIEGIVIYIIIYVLYFYRYVMLYYYISPKSKCSQLSYTLSSVKNITFKHRL